MFVKNWRSQHNYPSVNELRKNGKWPIHDEGVVSIFPLVEVIRNLGPNLIGCELGTHVGTSAIYLLEHVANIHTHVCVDPYISYNDAPGDAMPQDFYDYVKSVWDINRCLYPDRILFIHDTSDAACKFIEDESLDYVFVDGDHSYEFTLRDLENYWPKVKPGGLISGHDFNSVGWFGVNEAVRDFMKRQELGEVLQLSESKNCYWIYKNDRP